MARTKKVLEEKVVETKVEETKTEETKTAEGKKVKVKLLCDVYYNDTKLKEGQEIEIEEKELEKFADSFYKKS